MSKKAPPGWPPGQIAHRLDGFIGHEGRAPRAIAEWIFDAMPPIGGRSEIDQIRGRMLMRHHQHDLAQKVRIAREARFKRAKA
jgi:hypothetical protein